MQMNSKDHLKNACDEIKSASSYLNEAICNVEKNNNKKELQQTLSAVEKAMYAAANALNNYQD